jgi:hypothetical protein
VNLWCRWIVIKRRDRRAFFAFNIYLIMINFVFFAVSVLNPGIYGRNISQIILLSSRIFDKSSPSEMGDVGCRRFIKK